MPLAKSTSCGKLKKGPKEVSESRTARVLILSSGSILTALVSIFSGIVLTRLLSQHDVGTYRQAVLAMTFAVPFVMLGLDRVLFTFLPKETENPRATLVENLTWLMMAGGLLSSFALLGGNHLLAKRFDNPALAPLLAWFGLYALFFIPAAAVSAGLLARQRTRTLAVYNVTSRVINFIFVVGLVWFWRTPGAALLGVLAGTILNCLTGMWLMWHACPGTNWRPSAAGMRRQLLFAIPLGLASLMGTLTITMDQMIVSLRCTPADFAVYTVGAMEIPLISIITGSITSVVLVDYARFYQAGRLDEVVRLMQTAMSRSALILLPTMMLFWVLAPNLMQLLYGSAYAKAAVPVRIYLLLLPVRTLTFGAVFQATGSSRPILVNAAVGLVPCALLGWFLTGWLGPVGAALATVMTTYFFSLPYSVWVLRNRLQRPVLEVFPWHTLWRIAAASGLAAGITGPMAHFLNLNAATSVSLITAVFIPVALGGLIWFGAADWQMLKTTWNGLLPRRNVAGM